MLFILPAVGFELTFRGDIRIVRILIASAEKYCPRELVESCVASP